MMLARKSINVCSFCVVEMMRQQQSSKDWHVCIVCDQLLASSLTLQQPVTTLAGGRLLRRRRRAIASAPRTILRLPLRVASSQESGLILVRKSRFWSSRQWPELFSPLPCGGGKAAFGAIRRCRARGARENISVCLYMGRPVSAASIRSFCYELQIPNFKLGRTMGARPACTMFVHVIMTFRRGLLYGHVP